MLVTQEAGILEGQNMFFCRSYKSFNEQTTLQARHEACSYWLRALFNVMCERTPLLVHQLLIVTDTVHSKLARADKRYVRAWSRLHTTLTGRQLISHYASNPFPCQAGNVCIECGVERWVRGGFGRVGINSSNNFSPKPSLAGCLNHVSLTNVEI